MSDTQVKVAPPSLRRRILLRILSIVVAATVFSFVTNFVTTTSQKAPGPCGFFRGVLHGAMMPAAMPNLILGRDIVIYAPENTGRTYKLGYTCGVNGCGAIFFGISFWRVNRWRKRAKTSAT